MENRRSGSSPPQAPPQTQSPFERVKFRQFAKITRDVSCAGAIFTFTFFTVAEEFGDFQEEFLGSQWDADLNQRLQQLDQECLSSGSNNSSKNKSESGPPATKIKPFRCEECKACFHKAKELTAHRQAAHPEQHNAVIVSLPAAAASTTSAAAAAPPPSSRATVTAVTASMLRPYACPLCEARFKSCGARNAHRRKVHQRDHLCVQCDVAFGSAQKLARHLKTHVGVKEFRCETCNKEFSIERNLALHQKLHLGQKDYVCRVCSRTYYTRSGLQAHQRQMHTENAAGFRCSDCPERRTTREEG